MSAHDTSIKAIIYALLANLGIALSKTAGAVFTGSGSMLAESIHSYADCSNQLLLMLGLRRSRKKADSRHPLGYGKAIYFWSFIVAIMLFSMGGLFSVYEGIHKLTRPEPLDRVWLGLSILGVSIILETMSLLGALKESRKIRGDERFTQWIRETRKAELVVVLGEDAAALAGLSLAFIALVAAFITGNPLYDSLGSIAIGVILITVAVFIGARVKSLLIGESAEPEVEEEIRQLILSIPCVDRVFKLITIQLGNDIMLSVKCGLKDCGISLENAIGESNGIERTIKERYPAVKWSFFEFDVKD